MFLTSSCSLTPIEMEELDQKKAYYLDSNGDIIWKKQTYSKSLIQSKYNTEELFADNLEARKLVEQANELQHLSNLWLSSGVYMSVVFLALTERLAPKLTGLYLWIFLGIGVIPTLHYRMEANESAKQAVELYNQKNQVSIYPSFYENAAGEHVPGLFVSRSF